MTSQRKWDREQNLHFKPVAEETMAVKIGKRDDRAGMFFPAGRHCSRSLHHTNGSEPLVDLALQSCE